MNIKLRILYFDEDGKEYGLEESVTDSVELKPTVNFILTTLERDYNARHPGENTRWA